MEKTNKKKYIVNGIVLALILAALYRVLGQDAQEILASVRSISAGQLVLLLGFGLAYQLLDGWACYVLIHAQCPQVTYRQALCVVFLGTFGNVATFGAGTLPLQGYYLHRCGVQPGSGMGFVTLEYMLHKLGVVLFAAVTCVVSWRWLWPAAAPLRRYIVFGFAVDLAISLGLVLLCTWKRLRDLVLRLTGRLPSGGKWDQWKAAIIQNVEALYADSGQLLRSHRCCGKTVLVDLVKLAVLYTIPPLCLRMIGEAELPFGRGVALSAVALLVTGALPNVAGMGSLELAFMLVFPAFVPRGKASAMLVLYRVATYFFPLLLSVGVFWRVQKRASRGGTDMV